MKRDKGTYSYSDVTAWSIQKINSADIRVYFTKVIIAMDTFKNFPQFP
jgi:hypothetical protein